MLHPVFRRQGSYDRLRARTVPERVVANIGLEPTTLGLRLPQKNLFLLQLSERQIETEILWMYRRKHE
jgi:hypothetical protein